MTRSSRTRLRRLVVPFCVCLIIRFLLVEQTAAAQTTPTGTVTGTVHNGTTNQPAPEGTQVTLHAYNSSYTSTETITAAVDADGRFQFSLTDKPADWVYMVSADYQSLSFSSNIGPLSGSQPLDLSLTIYEPTSDPANVVIDQLDISVNLVGQEAQVSELYTISNEGTAVFTGASGSSANGTVQIALPQAAHSPVFERGMGPTSGFFFSTEFVQRDGRWTDTLPLRPGPNSLTLRVAYSLPAADLNLSRTLPYQATSIMLAVPDGLQFASDGWQQQATQSAGERGALRQFSRANLVPGSELRLTFSASSPAETTTLSTAWSGDWILSLLILLLVTSIAFRLLRPNKRETAVPAPAAPASPRPAASGERHKAERWQLLFALADLDNAYKNGRLPEAEYQHQRQEIKNRLRAIWELV
ncbi:MAG: hypothetical protein IPM53_15145 [Anaerolineaceae bacterium]|nr:hypothetical protein [Anaerolineaceae bacterium]